MMSQPVELPKSEAVDLLVAIGGLPTVYPDGLSELTYDRPCLVPCKWLPYDSPLGPIHLLTWEDGLMIISRELLGEIT